jgi:hypothetical protein
MTFSRKTLLTAVITLGALTVAQDVQAGCGRGGYRRGYSRGYSRSYSSPSYNYGSYSPSHSSGYGYSQSVPSVRTIQSQPIAPQQQFNQPQQQFGQPPQQQQFAPQQSGGQPQQQQFSPQQNAAPQQQQQIGQQQFTQPQTAVPQQQQPPQQSAPAPSQTGNVRMTALQALGSFAPPQTTPAHTQSAAYVGNWTATLDNGANVRLTLQSDGNFSWSATNKTGTASSFSGSYTVGNGSLALIRGNDNQRLEGDMTNSGQNAFSFKVAGNNAGAISFSRN